MSKAQYSRLRAEALTPEAQARHAEWMATYHQRPEIIAASEQIRRDDHARDERYVRRTVARFIADHPVLAKRYKIALDGDWKRLTSALYDCYAESGRTVGRLMDGHGSFYTDVDPHGIQGAWLAAARLAEAEKEKS